MWSIESLREMNEIAFLAICVKPILHRERDFMRTSRALHNLANDLEEKDHA